jgi:hypothetical protein
VFKSPRKQAVRKFSKEGARSTAPVLETLEARQLLSLVGVTPDFPLIAYDFNGAMAYNSTTGALDVTATPLVHTSLTEGSPILPPRGLQIHLNVNGSGQASGVAGDDLVVSGVVTVNGHQYSGTLLTGEVERFGYEYDGPTNLFDYVFRPTGGALLGEFIGHDIGITMTSEVSTFNGGFSADFTGHAKGTIGTVPSIFNMPPDIHIVKAGPVIANAGDNITYTYQVTTTSIDPLSNVTVMDDKAGAATFNSGDTNSDGYLEQGETWLFSAAYTLPAIGCGTGPIINTATATGTYLFDTVTDKATYQLNPYVLNKKLYLFFGGCKGTVAYTQPDDTLFNVQVTKDGQAIGAVAVSAAQNAQLWLANGSYSFQEATPPDGYINVTGGALTYTTGQGTAKGTFKNVITYDLEVEKTGPATANAGDKITYTYTVTNAGPAAVTPVLSDDKAGTPKYQSGDTNDDGLIETGETWIYTALYTVPTTKSGSGCGDWGGWYGGSCGGYQTYCGTQPTGSSITNIVTVDAVENIHSSSAIGGDRDMTNNTDTWTVQIGKATITLGSLSGKVYLDSNNNGLIDSRDQGLSCVQVILTGTDDLGQTVHKTVWTDCNGNYKFANLRPGVYSISHTQPKGFTEGKDAVGSLGGSLIDNAFANIVLASGGKGVNYNFAEVLKQSGGCGGHDWNFCGWNYDDWKQWDYGCNTNWSCGGNWSWNWSCGY